MRKAHYLNREISWLRFNDRVLGEARRETLPLLERVKFLAISASNLDEFFMVRVGGLRALSEIGSRTCDITGLTPSKQLSLLQEELTGHVAQQYRLWETELEPALSEHGIRRRRMEDLTESTREGLSHYFQDHLEDLLNPVAIEMDAVNFRIPARKICLCLRVGPNEDTSAGDRLVVIAIPNAVPRFIPVSDAEADSFVLAEDLIAENAGAFFPDEHVKEASAFRLTRNGDIPVREDYAFDLTDAMEAVLTARKFSKPVRLEVHQEVPDAMLETLLELSGADRTSLFRVSSILDLSSLMTLVGLPGHEALRDETWKPQACIPLRVKESIFEVLDEEDLLLHHPYDSFEPVIRLVEEAADDPNVVAIKQILYRTARESRIISALIRAAQKGKHVVVLVELKARFDEARNLERAEELELAGAQVVYGIKSLKTHAKACLIMRRESGRLRRYVHFGTGNYNEATANLYTDVSYLTARSDYGADAAALFNAITGRSQLLGFRRLLPAPTQLKKRILQLIEFETNQAKAGQPAKIMAKVNGLQDKEIIDALYQASQSGVTIKLMVRGICCLRAGVPKLSENIQVHSLIDRYLEHARLFHFHHGGESQVFLSSADWMVRNLEKRIELLVPIDDSASKDRVIEILERQFQDNTQAWHLLEDGTYSQIENTSKSFRLQAFFQKQATRRAKEEEKAALGVLELHVPRDQVHAS